MGQLLFILSTGLLIGIVLARTVLRRQNTAPARKLPPKPLDTPPTPLYQPESSHIPEDTSSLEQKMRLEEERDFLFKLNEKLNVTRDTRSVASTIAEEVRSFLNVAICALYVYDTDRDRLNAEAVSGIPLETFAPKILQRGESVTGEVMRTRQSLVVNDLAANAFYGPMNNEPYLRNACLIVPIVSQNELYGVISAGMKKSSAPFREGDQAFMTNVARVGALAFKNCRLLSQMHKDYLNTITTLALLIDARDPYTKRHSENVTRYAVALAREMNLTTEQTEIISRAGLLHDIGKIGIRDDVLLKPGKLTNEEFEIIKSHAARGAEIVATLPALAHISFLVRHHHEKYDGKGYPDGKKGEEIELGARVLAVADTFDAMTTDRPYRKALTLQEAGAELVRCKGTQFDPMLVDCFLRVIEKNPDLLTSSDQVSSPPRPARSIP